MPVVSADAVLTAIDRVAEHLPDLRISPWTWSADGKTWVVDLRSTTIYILKGRDIRLQALDLLAALDALCRHYDIPASERRLRLIPGRPSPAPAQPRTGTSSY